MKYIKLSWRYMYVLSIMHVMKLIILFFLCVFSLHSNSQLDINIKGQMIRDLMNLAGFRIPDKADVLHSNSVAPSATEFRWVTLLSLKIFFSFWEKHFNSLNFKVFFLTTMKFLFRVAMFPLTMLFQ